ncbi:MAG: hypothetical protein II567_06645 [Candidatus Riflebacteria bacterium]|jgi:hypothetical protein|nr:hypothetical protein [Candidatus Riflebacteria bacterium]
MSKRGMSLVEILIASAVFLAAVIPLWGLMGSSHQQVTRSADEIKASQLTVEILEQLENSQNIKCLPEDNTEKEYKLESGGEISLGSEPPVVLKVGTFDEYMSPNLVISAKTIDDGYNNQYVIGCVVTLEMNYKSKEGRDSSYTLRGFISANN